MQGTGRSFGRIVAVERLASVLNGFHLPPKVSEVSMTRCLTLLQNWYMPRGPLHDSVFCDGASACETSPKAIGYSFMSLFCHVSEWNWPMQDATECNRHFVLPISCVLAELCSFQDCKLGAWGAWSACNANVTQQRPMAMARGSKEVKLPCASEYFCWNSYQRHWSPPLFSWILESARERRRGVQVLPALNLVSNCCCLHW